jgi:hypothetical protein
VIWLWLRLTGFGMGTYRTSGYMHMPWLAQGVVSWVSGVIVPGLALVTGVGVVLLWVSEWCGHVFGCLDLALGYGCYFFLIMAS